MTQIRKIQPFWSNPVLVRDIRVSLRGKKTFAGLGVYVAILLLITLLEYIGATKSSSASEVQSQLHGFYMLIFGTLAAIVTVASPALSASSIVIERQLLTLDLLATTPMSGVQILAGKLWSSFAFILLLLFLSLPASGLCVVLGGATFSDLVQSYAILLIDGVVFSSIGLIYSATSKTNVQAMIRTYATVAACLIATAFVSALSFGANIGSEGNAGVASGIVFLNPFMLLTAGVIPWANPGMLVHIGAWHLPAYIFTVLFALIFIANNLTAAAIKLNLYGDILIGRLRIQTLLTIFIFGVVIMSSFSAGSSSPIILSIWIFGMMSVAMLGALFGLPSLFVPQFSSDDLPLKKFVGWFRIKNILNDAHSGSFPFFVLCFAVLLFSGVLGEMIDGGLGIILDWKALFSGLFYLCGLGFLYWGIARRCAWLANSKNAAAILSFVIFVAILVVPLCFMPFGAPDFNIRTTASRTYWLLSPYVDMIDNLSEFSSSHAVVHSFNEFLEYGAAAYILGLLFYPFWLPLVAGEQAALRASKNAALKAAKKA